jgi:hypothetical protein
LIYLLLKTKLAEYDFDNIFPKIGTIPINGIPIFFEIFEAEHGMPPYPKTDTCDHRA